MYNCTFPKMVLSIWDFLLILFLIRRFPFIFHFQIKKMGSYIEKAVHKMNKQREKYEEALIEVTTCFPNYEKEMKSLFLMCQRMEETKFKLFHLVLLSIANSLKVMPNQKFVLFIVTVLRSILSFFFSISGWPRFTRTCIKILKI